MDTEEQLNIQIVRGELLSETDRKHIILFCTKAYEEDMEPFFKTFLGATHVLGYLDETLVSHGLWVTRHLQVGSGPILRTAYVEAVATEKAFRRCGFAATIMNRLAEEVQDYDLAALSPFRVSYYQNLGWERWRGPLFIRTDKGLLPTPADEDVMVLRLPNTPKLNLDASLSAEWREGELW